jgi:hypothetical protein
MNDFDCGVSIMRSGFVLALAFVVAIAATPGAYAFQEQKGATPPAAEAQPQAPAEAPADATTGARLNEETAAKPEAGTEIRIPGLGKLGVLPKMDFGLELLYGAAEQGQPASQPEALTPPDDDVTVRGSVKHRF